MKIKVCLLMIFGFLLFFFSKAEANITWSYDDFDYNATDAGGYYYNPSLSPPLVVIGASSDLSQANGNTENAAVASITEPPQGVSAPGLSMASGAWGNSFQDLTQDSGGATVYAYADNTYALDDPIGVLSNLQNVSSYIDRTFTVSSSETYTLTASAAAPLDWSGTTSGSATAPQPNLTGWVYLLQADSQGIVSTVQSFSLATLLGSPQQASVSLVSGDTYQLVVALENATSLGGTGAPAGIVTSFNNIDNGLNWLGGIDGNFNAGTQANPITITATVSPVVSLWQGATDNGNGWLYLGWFGNFYTNASTAWIYHQTLGWLYPEATSTDNLWFYDPQWDGQGGWWWTSNSLFPWIYSVTESEWLYYDASATGGRWFFTSSGQAAEH